MSSRARQGRPVPRKRSPMPYVYLALGVIVLLSIGLLLSRMNRGPESSAGTPVGTPLPAINAPVGKTPEGFYYKGSPDAPVKVVEYADFQCPACASFTEQLEGTINKTYIETGKVQMIYHDFPLPQHNNAIKAAEAARCAGDQGQFWPMHALLFSRQNEWEGDRNVSPRLVRYAGELGLNTQSFDSCLATNTYTQALRDAAASAATQGINATPTFVVDGQKVDSSQLQQAIEAALAAKGQ